MMKVKTTNFNSAKEILLIPDHHVGIAVMVSDEGVAVTQGRKIVPAGTLLGEGSNEQMTTVNSEKTLGVLLSDTEVTYGPAPASMIVHGFINLSKIPEPPSEDAKAALTLIRFM